MLPAFSATTLEGCGQWNNTVNMLVPDLQSLVRAWWHLPAQPCSVQKHLIFLDSNYQLSVKCKNKIIFPLNSLIPLLKKTLQRHYKICWKKKTGRHDSQKQEHQPKGEQRWCLESKQKGGDWPLGGEKTNYCSLLLQTYGNKQMEGAKCWLDAE